jgi:hypothetical protein
LILETSFENEPLEKDTNPALKKKQEDDDDSDRLANHESELSEDFPRISQTKDIPYVECSGDDSEEILIRNPLINYDRIKELNKKKKGFAIKRISPVGR